MIKKYPIRNESGKEQYIITSTLNERAVGLSSVFSILPSASDVNPMDEQQLIKPKKKKKRGKKI